MTNSDVAAAFLHSTVEARVCAITFGCIHKTTLHVLIGTGQRAFCTRAAGSIHEKVSLPSQIPAQPFVVANKRENNPAVAAISECSAHLNHNTQQ